MEQFDYLDSNCEECQVEIKYKDIFIVECYKQGVKVKLEVCKNCKNDFKRRK